MIDYAVDRTGFQLLDGVMSNLFNVITTVMTRAGISVSTSEEAVVFRRATQKAVIPVWGDPQSEPTPETLFYQALVVIAGFEDCEDFPDWCDEYGFDAADADQLTRFKAIDAGRADLIGLIGEERLNELIMGLRIGQAIHAARPR